MNVIKSMQYASAVIDGLPVNFKRTACASCIAAFALTGCYVIPIGPDGAPYYAVGVPAANPPHGTVPGSPMPVVLNARLYPANDLANQTGIITGTVTNMLSGKGRFQFDYQGELLTGEATRVSGDDRRGMASAYGPRGTYVSCEYQMSTPRQGAGTCNFSNGAKYQVHLGG
jgi:hypothetical protein